MGKVIAFSGRRIDAADTDIGRFPLGNCSMVEQRLSQLFEQENASAIVASAACGADLLALKVASLCGMKRRIVLPYAVERFRATSVVDRPGDWGPLFDQIITEVALADDLVILENQLEGLAAYRMANKAILDGVEELAPKENILAVAVWEGCPRAGEDLTFLFSESARERGIAVAEVLTLTDRQGMMRRER